MAKHDYHPKVQKGEKVWVIFQAVYEGENAIGEPIVSWNEAKQAEENKPRSSMVPTFAFISEELLTQ